MRMPVSSNATREGNGNLRLRVNALGCSECRAIWRNSADCNRAARSVKKAGRDMVANEEKSHCATRFLSVCQVVFNLFSNLMYGILNFGGLLPHLLESLARDLAPQQPL